MALTKITNDLLDLGSDTGALELPKGTTAQRPSNPVEGTLRHNSEIDETKLETFDGTDWRKINKVISTYAVDYLVVAGGGGSIGAVPFSAGYGAAGAGGYIYETNKTLQKGVNYIVTVGAGGAGAPDGNSSGVKGEDSQFLTSIAVGGGLSGLSENNGGDGGSGGGARQSGSGGAGTSGQGFAGGSGNGGDGGCGGGGASQAGFSQSGNTGGAGGAGVSISITGTSITYAGGGGGGGYNFSAGGNGGAGGGGNGKGDNTPGGNGTPNLGGGGGATGGIASGGSNVAGGSGGSGVVILRMPTANYSGTTTGSPTVTTDGTDTILTYTSSGTYTA